MCRQILIVVIFVLLHDVSDAQTRLWTDATGKFQIEAELVTTRGGKVVLEKPDGKLVVVPIAKLSDEDREFLDQRNKPVEVSPTESVDMEQSPSNPEVKKPRTVAVKQTDSSITVQTKEVLKTACYRCHGQDGTSEGGFNFVLNLDKLGKTFAEPGEDSLLMERIKADDDSVMPPVGEEPRLSDSNIALLQSWIDAGAPAVEKREREFVSNDRVVEMILADITSKPERSQRFMRYFTLTHLYNAGVSDDELQTYRNAFKKLINSLSWNTDLVIPQAVDDAKTIFGLDMRDLHWHDENWKAIESANPYFLNLATATSDSCVEKTQTSMPFVRIDWFVFAASKPPLYHDMLSLPQSDVELERLLRVNVEANISQEKVIRAGFNRSGVSQNNRLIEWHKSPYGSYWKSYDFGGNLGHQNLFQYPMGPNYGSESFKQDGGEIIFSLPNGLQGYFLVDERGQRIDQGPTNIVSDPKRLDRTVTNGVSCMSCHYSGIIPKKDEVGFAVRSNPSAFEDADDILALYRDPVELDRKMNQDVEKFSDVLLRLGISNLSRSGESISAMALRFQQDIDLGHVASEFGLLPADFLERLKGASQVARVFSSLRIAGGTIKRDVFKDMFGEACRDLEITKSNERSQKATRSRSSSRNRNVVDSRGGKTRKVDLHAGSVKRVAFFDDMGWGFSAVAIDPSGNFLVAGGVSAELTGFSVKHESLLSKLSLRDLMGSISAIEYSADGSQLFVAGYKGAVQVYSVNKRGQIKPSSRFVGHSEEVGCIAISNDGKYALTGSQEEKVRYWEVESGKELHVLTGFKGKIKAVDISADGRRIRATDGALLIDYDVNKQETIHQRPLTRSWSSGQAAAFSPDGKFIAVGDSYDIRVWDLETGREFPKLDGNEIQWSIVFSPDSSYLLSGGRGKINVWDPVAGKRIVIQEVDGGYVQGLGVSHDGKTFSHAATTGNPLSVFQFTE